MRHELSSSSRSRPLKDSIQAFCQGEPGSMNIAPVPLNRHQSADGVRDELGAVEFLTVVKRFRVVHAGVGASGVLKRSATPFVTRSSLRFALRTLEIDRRAARTSGGIW